MRATSGHVFVIQGTIGKVVSDAAVVSTDRVFTVENHWRTRAGASERDRLAEHRPDGWAAQGWGRSSKASSNVWFVDVTAARTGGWDAFDRLRLLEADDRELVRDAEEFAAKIRRGSGCGSAWLGLLEAFEVFCESSELERPQRQTYSAWCGPTLIAPSAGSSRRARLRPANDDSR